MLDTFLLIIVITFIFYYIFTKEQKRERREIRKMLDELKDSNKETNVTIVEKPVPYLIPFNRFYRWYFDPPYYYDPFYHYGSNGIDVNATIIKPNHKKRKPHPKSKPKSLSKK